MRRLLSMLLALAVAIVTGCGGDDDEEATTAAEDATPGVFDQPEFDELRSFLHEISHQRAVKGYTAVENASYILSLRDALIPLLAEEMDGNSAGLVREMTYVTRLLDRMGLVMVETFLRSREEIIRQQRADMMELSTPVIKVWDKILTLPDDDGIAPAKDRRDRLDHRHLGHHGRPHDGHARRQSLDKNRHGVATDGCALHSDGRLASHRADDGATRHRPDADHDTRANGGRHQAGVGNVGAHCRLI